IPPDARSAGADTRKTPRSNTARRDEDAHPCSTGMTGRAGTTGRPAGTSEVHGRYTEGPSRAYLPRCRPRRGYGSCPPLKPLVDQHSGPLEALFPAAGMISFALV